MVIAWKSVPTIVLFVLVISATFTTNQIHAQQQQGSVGGQIGGAPWMIPFDMVADVTDDGDKDSNKHYEFFASAMVYDSELDRVYVTGVSHTQRIPRRRRHRRTLERRSESSIIPTPSPSTIGDDTTQYDDYNNNDDDDEYRYDDDMTDASTGATSDCFLGILQVPRRGSTDSTINTNTISTTNNWVHHKRPALELILYDVEMIVRCI
jgi:hypothetical protein